MIHDDPDSALKSLDEEDDDEEDDYQEDDGDLQERNDNCAQRKSSDSAARLALD